MHSIHDYVLQRLQSEKGNWPAIARAAGISYFSLKKIATLETSSPGIKNLEKLATYFEKAS